MATLSGDFFYRLVRSKIQDINLKSQYHYFTILQFSTFKQQTSKRPSNKSGDPFGEEVVKKLYERFEISPACRDYPRSLILYRQD